MQDTITRKNPIPNNVFVVTDGSTDDTGQIGSRYAPLVTCIQVTNSGQGLTRRVAMAQSTAPWIVHCDCDETCDPGHLQRMAELIAGYPGMLFTHAEFYPFGFNGNTTYRRMQYVPQGWGGQHMSHTKDSFHLVAASRCTPTLLWRPRQHPPGATFATT